MNTSELVGMSTGNLLKVHVVSPDLMFLIYFYLGKKSEMWVHKYSISI